ncbi:hypothetical protein Lalb_Chr17g0343411 [Lupinus albus]|uniref:COP1-interacting protein 7 n=1 Tax=Lupinus albus TaxID=3870 RepID=A0A6A4PA96_LUPAL|nr:hypothetical protein Lalb_Chr17g0343411 [Lupinus albus]
MKSDTLLDYALLQLSPKRSRCELFVSSDGNTEKLSSGLVKPFLTHLKFAEEQVALAAQSIKLETERHKNAGTWFTKGTLERFVQFVSTPEVLEMVIKFDAEMSQLEAAQRIYSQGAGDQRTDSQGGNGTGAVAAADATTKELLRAIDVRLGAVRQDLTTSCARAAAAGFNPHTVSQLQHFAQQFLAHRLSEACAKYMSLYERRPDIISPRKQGSDDRELRSSIGSDMSIDTDNGTHLRPNHSEAQANAPEPAKPSTWQHPKSFATFQRCSSNNLNQKCEANNDNNQKEECPGPNESSPSTPPSGPATRRLSVQDRISLFENKQKENSSGSGPKPVVGKSIELRRLPANVSLSTEKPILRRWSGVSDMSIEVSGDKKDNDSPLCTPSSVSSVSQTKSSEEDKDPNNNSNSEVNADQVVRTDQQSSQDTSNISIFNQERTSDSGGFKDQEERTFESHLRSSEVVGRKTSQLSFGVVTTSVMSDVKLSGMREDGGMKNHAVATPPLIRGSHGHSRSQSAQFEGNGVKLREGSVRGKSSQSTTTGPGLRSFTRDLDVSSFSINQKKSEESEVPKMRYQKPQPGSREQISKSRGKRDEIRGANESSKLDLPGKQVLESQADARLSSTAPSEQVQRVRNFKGNQGLHDELKLKADELEKLFEEHKLRVPGDQPGSARRTEPADAYMKEAVNSHFRRPGVVESTPPLPSRNTGREMTTRSSNVAMSDAKSLVKTMDIHEYGNDALRKSFSDLSFSDDSRGIFYEKYMKKRNAKLKEEWSSNRAEKEARMKAIQDSLEQSRSEMKAKFLGSTNRQDLVLGAHHADKLKYFKSNVEKGQHPIDLLQNEVNDYLSEFSEENVYATSRQSRKNLPNRHMPSATPHTTTTRSYGRRRDNPIAQSVPNFSDLRKENTKPSSGVSKTTSLQVRNYDHSKSTTEEMQCVQEEKIKRTQSLRKNSANPSELKHLPPLNSGGVVLTPLRFHMDQTDLGPHDQSPKSLLKNANIVGSGSVGNTFRMKASMASSTQKTEEFEELEYEVEESLHMTIEEQDVIETMAIEGYAYNNGKVRLSQEPEKSDNSASEIGDSTRSLSQVDPISVGEMPTAFPSTFNSVGSLQDSPAESPMSWNSHMHRPFPYLHESSDIDAYADSPIGSPPSWNSHSLTQVENDAARMRKKWGSAQKPFLVPNPSQNQPRKDVTRGFKRLLKFGRKSRGSESLVDWISATTSEGDDDTEDGRDPANRSSEDLRKSRMGFSHCHPSDDSFNENELFNEHVQSMQSSIPAPPAHFSLRDDHISGSSLKAPKSFFSLSTFRSKGSDSKPR